MAETVEETVVGEEDAGVRRPTLCLCEQYGRVTEGAALTAARWLGRDDQEAAERDASAAMRAVLDDFPIEGQIVIGSVDEDSPLHVTEVLGAGGDAVDLALDPLEGRGVVARGGNAGSCVRMARAGATDRGSGGAGMAERMASRQGRQLQARLSALFQSLESCHFGARFSRNAATPSA